MSRPRATYHCRECLFYAQALGFCQKGGLHPVTYKEERTSPRWCPRGHVIPGKPYPTFSQGKDPREPEAVQAAIRAR